MAKFHLTNDAKQDLINIRHYTVEQWGSEQSKKYLLELQQTILLLTESPNIGKKRPDVLTDTLSFPHSSHIIYYLQKENSLLIFAVLHKSMVPNPHLDRRDTSSTEI